MKETVRRKSICQKLLFFLYLLTLGIALAMFADAARDVGVAEMVANSALGARHIRLSGIILTAWFTGENPNGAL